MMKYTKHNDNPNNEENIDKIEPLVQNEGENSPHSVPNMAKDVQNDTKKGLTPSEEIATAEDNIELSEGKQELPDTDKTQKEKLSKGKAFKEFVSKNIILIITLAALLVVIAMLAAALIFGGEYLDKLAVIWLALLVVDVINLKHSGKKVGYIVTTVLAAIFAVAFTVLYILSLAGVI